MLSGTEAIIRGMKWTPNGFGLLLQREETGRCDLCDVPFYSTRDAVAHLQTIEHADAVGRARAEREQQKAMLPFIHDPEFGDPEIEAHMRRVGQRMRREGRWTVNPSEKAGFS